MKVRFSLMDFLTWTFLVSIAIGIVFTLESDCFIAGPLVLSTKGEINALQGKVVALAMIGIAAVGSVVFPKFRVYLISLIAFLWIMTGLFLSRFIDW